MLVTKGCAMPRVMPTCVNCAASCGQDIDQALAAAGDHVWVCRKEEHSRQREQHLQPFQQQPESSHQNQQGKGKSIGICCIFALRTLE